MVGVSRWNANVGAYILLMRDEYPPFDLAAGKYPVTYELAYPADPGALARPREMAPPLPALSGAGCPVHGLLRRTDRRVVCDPVHSEVPPRPLDFQVGVLRWSYWVTAYFYLMRDEYPPFTLS
jgi:hypothetical protein